MNFRLRRRTTFEDDFVPTIVVHRLIELLRRLAFAEFLLDEQFAAIDRHDDEVRTVKIFGVEHQAVARRRAEFEGKRAVVAQEQRRIKNESLLGMELNRLNGRKDRQEKEKKPRGGHDQSRK